MKLGETLDDGTTLNKYSQGLLSVGINIKDASGELRDMDEILNDIGATWGKLNKDQLVALAQTVAGVRLYNQFMSLFDNWDFMEQNLEWAYGADGTLDEQANIYAESWEAASKRVQAAAEDIYNTLIDNDAFIDLLNVTEDALVAVNGLIDAMGGLPGVLALIGTISTKVFGEQIANGLKNTMYTMTDLRASVYNNNTKILNKFGKGQNRKQQLSSAEKLRQEASLQMQEQGTNLAMQGMGSSALAFLSIGKLQDEMLIRSKKMTEYEKMHALAIIERTLLQTKELLAKEDEINASQRALALETNITLTEQDRANGFGEELQIYRERIRAYQEVYKLVYEISLLENAKSIGGVDKRRINAELIEKRQLLADVETSVDGYFMSDYLFSDVNTLIREVGDYALNDILDDSFLILGSPNNGISRNVQNQVTQVEEVISRSRDALNVYQKDVELVIATTANGAKIMEKLGNGIQPVSQSIIGMTSSLSSLTMGFTSAWSGILTFTSALDDNHVSLSEVLSILMSLTMAVPMLSSGWDTLTGHFKELLKAASAKELTAAGILETDAMKKKLTVLEGAWLRGAYQSQKNGNWDAIYQLALLAKNSGGLMPFAAEAEQNYENLKKQFDLTDEFFQMDAFLRKQYLKNLAKTKVAIKLNTEATEIENHIKNTGLFTLIRENVTIGANTIDTEANTVARLKNVIAMKLQLAAASSLLGVIAAIGAAIAVTVAAVYLGVKAWNKDADALKEATQATLHATEAYEELKSTYNDLKDTLSDWNELIENIKALKEGTTEWSDAIQEANTKVLDLLSTYSELYKYIETDTNSGLMSISERGLEYILNQERAALLNSLREVMNRLISENSAKNANDVTNWVRKNDSGLFNGTERTIINSLLEDYQKDGNVALKNAQTADALADLFGITVQSAERLIEGGISDLIIALNNNTSANEVLNNQMNASVLLSHSDTYNTSEHKDALNAYYNDKVSRSSGYSVTANLSNNEYLERYAAIQGLSNDEWSNRSLGIGNVTYGEGTDHEQEISWDEIKSAVLAAAKNYVAYDENELSAFEESLTSILDSMTFSKAFEALGEEAGEALLSEIVNVMGQGSGTAIADFVNQLSYEETNALASVLEDGGTTAAFQSFFENNKSYFAVNGFSSAQAFLDAFKQAIGELDAEEANRLAEILEQANWQNMYDEVGASFEVDADAVEGYAETLQSLYPSLEGNIEATKAAAELNIRFSQGYDTLVSTLDDYEDKLQYVNDGSFDAQLTLAAVGNAYEEMTGVHVSNDFISENLEEILKLAAGDVSVLEELGQAAAKDYIVHLEIPEADKTTITSFLDKLALDDRNIAIGASVDVDTTEFTARMKEMILAGEITAEEVNTALGSMGYHAELETYLEEQSVTTHHEVNGTGFMSWLSYSYDDTQTTNVDIPVLNGDIKKVSSPQRLGSSVSKGQAKKDSGGKDNEMERYHTVSNLLETLENLYEKIAAAKDKAYGADKLKYLDQEIEKQDQIIQKQKEYLALAQANLKLDKSRMSAYGAKYDEDGNITNYRTLFKKYGQDDTFLKRLEKYEESLHLVEEKEAAYQTELIEWKSLQYEKIISTFDYGLEQDKKALEVMEKMSKHLSDDVYKTAEAFAVLMTGLDGKGSRVDTLEHDMHEYQAQKDALDEAWANGELNEADYVEGLNNTMDGMLEMVDTYEELIDTVKEYYGNTLKQAQEELKHYTDQIDNALKKLQHFQKVQELSGKGTDYETTLELLSAQMQVTKDSFDVAQQWYNSRAEDEAKIRARLAAIDKETRPVEWEIENQKLRDAMAATQDAYDSMASYREQYLELAEEQYKTTIDKIAAYASSTLAGEDFLSLDSLLDSMQNVSTRADEYLTKTNKLYETEKLRKQVLADMDKTSNKAAKERLNNFTKEIDAAQQQNELSNLELEILQAKYKQLQAQIALEEAQNAKNTVRLSRDNEGNYGYIYTADKDNIADAEQTLADADNDLYNIRLKAFNDYSEKKIQAEKDLNDKIKEIWQDETLSYEEKEKEIQRIAEEHYAIIDAYTDLATIALAEDARILADAWAAAYSKQSLDSTNWKNVVQDCLGQATSASKAYHEAIDPMVDTTKGKYDTLSEAIKGTADEADALTKEIEDTVIPTLDDEIGKVDELTTAYGNNLLGIADVVESLKKDYIPSILATIENIKELTKAQNNLNKAKAEGSGSGENGEKPASSTSSSPSKEEKTTSSGKDISTYRAVLYLKKLGSTMFVHTSSVPCVSDAAVNEMIKTWIKRYSTYKEVDRVTKVVSDRKTTSLFLLQKTGAEAMSEKAQALKKNTSGGKNKADSVGLASGGYTGDWGDASGKLAMLHRKELVLNAEDTKNFLAGINVVRDISKAIDLQTFYSNTSNYSSSIKPISSASTLQQEVMIKAEFPNATNHTEIEQAFDTLISKAAQYANRRE